MKDIITFRVSEETKHLMEEMDLNWSEELRAYIEARIKSFKLHKLLPDIYADAERIRVKGDSTSLIRKDRDER
jgi:collagenase-like PrtC family protease